MVNWFIYFLYFLLALIFSFFLIYILGNRETSNIDNLRTQEFYSYFDGKNGKTAFYSLGNDNDEPLILIHGVSVPSYYYKNVATHLTEIGYKVYLYDHFGRGFSDRPTVKYDMSLYEEQLDDFVNYLSLEKVTLLGVSMGGAIAANYSANNQKKVKALILNVPFVGTQTITPRSFSSLPLIRDFYLRFFIIKSFITRGSRLTDDNQDPNHFISQFNIKGTQYSFNSLFKNFLQHDFLNDYNLINQNKTPVHFTYATDDEDVPLESVLNAISLIPSAKSYSFEGGHNIINIKTEEIISLIADFKSD